MSDAIMGTFVKIGTMADGTPRIVLDLQCTLSEIAAMGLIPGVPFALARMTKEASVGHGETRTSTASKDDSTPKNTDSMATEKPGQLCVMACNFCDDPLFWKWIVLGSPYSYKGADAQDAKHFILDICGIDSRKALDSDLAAAREFHRHIREPFLAWKAKQ